MYDVMLFEGGRALRCLAQGLVREQAAELARVEARREGVGRMFLAGSPSPCSGRSIMVVEAAVAEPTIAA